MKKKENRNSGMIIFSCLALNLARANNYYLAVLADHPLRSDVNLQISFTGLNTFLQYSLGEFGHESRHFLLAKSFFLITCKSLLFAKRFRYFDHFSNGETVAIKAFRTKYSKLQFWTCMQIKTKLDDSLMAILFFNSSN